MTKDLNKLNLSNINKILDKVSLHFNASYRGKIKWGWHYKSLGSKVIIKGDPFWIRISYYDYYDKAYNFIERLKSFNQLPHINKPEVLNFWIWEEKGYWLAIIMTYVEEPTLTDGSVLENYISIDQTWLERLKLQLHALSHTPSSYINCSSDLIKRRIIERFGLSAPNNISNWCTIHGDLHWGNLTNKTPFILDWEGSGTGPRSLDISLLYCFSLLNPIVSSKIKELFKSILNGSDGRVCQLFCCSELLRMNELHGDHPELNGPLKELAKNLLHNKVQ